MLVPPKTCYPGPNTVSVGVPRSQAPGTRAGKGHRKGFTLVETVLALGIVVFTMIPILSLIPVGIDSQHEAISSTVESQIVQAVSSEIALTDYARVISTYSDPAVSYYNDEGALLTSERGMVYTVKVSLKDVAAPVDTSVSPVGSLCALIQVTRVSSPAEPHLYSLIIPKE